jgi:hypothetical protein
MKGYFLTCGVSNFANLADGQQLPAVSQDLPRLRTLFENWMRLEPVPGIAAAESGIIRAALTSLETWAGNLREEVTLVLYLATHGMCPATGYCLLESDAEFLADNSLNTGKTVAASAIANCISKPMLAQVVVILDCCHAALGAIEFTKQVLGVELKHGHTERKVDFLCSSRTAAVLDGQFVPAFEAVVRDLGRQSSKGHLDIAEIVAAIEKAPGLKGEKVWHHPCLVSTAPCQRLPNGHVFTGVLSASDRLRIVESIESALLEEDKLPRDWLLLAWHEAGCYPLTDAQSSWQWQLQERMGRREGAAIALLESFRALADGGGPVHTALQKAQEEIAALQQPDAERRTELLKTARAQGIKAFEEFRHWHQQPAEVHIERAPGKAERGTVAIAGIALPLAATEDAKSPGRIKITPGQTIHFLLPHKQIQDQVEAVQNLGKPLGKRHCVTVHPWERWFSEEEVYARADMLRKRQDMAAVGSALALQPGANVGAEISEGTPVILFPRGIESVSTANFPPDAWQQWPAALQNQRNANPPADAVLVFDAPGFWPAHKSRLELRAV